MPQIPDIRQKDNFGCGEKVALSLLKFWGRAPKIFSMSHELDGTHPATVVAILRTAGLKVLSGEANIEIVKALTKAGFPVIVLIQYDGDGHYVIVGDVKRGKVEYQCPINGPSKETIEKFEKEWHDVDMWGAHYRRFIIVGFPT